MRSSGLTFPLKEVFSAGRTGQGHGYTLLQDAISYFACLSAAYIEKVLPQGAFNGLTDDISSSMPGC